MRATLALAAAAAVLSSLIACDPTEKRDMSCTAEFEGVSQTCAQLHITDPEGLVAKAKCEGDLDGNWSGDPCTSTDRVAGGHCKVEASEYSLSGTDVKVYFYAPVTLLEAQAACTAADGEWVE
jgi:hypothetical protein